MSARYTVYVSYTITGAQKLHTVQDEICFHIFLLVHEFVSVGLFPLFHYVAKIAKSLDPKCTNSLGQDPPSVNSRKLIVKIFQ